MTQSSSWVGFIVAAAMVVAIVILPYLLFGQRMEHWSASQMQGTEAHVAAVGALLLAADIFLPVPSSLVATALGALVGFALAAVANAAGLTVGCLLGLWAGRGGKSPVVRFLGPERYEQFRSWTAAHGALAVFLCRPVPVVAEASILIAGAAHVRSKELMVAATFANIALALIYAYAGSAATRRDFPELIFYSAAIGVPALAALVVIFAIRRASLKRS